MTNLFHTQLHLFLYFFTYPAPVFNHTTRLGTVWRNFKSSSKHGSKLIASISFSLLIFLVKDILYRVQNRHELGSEFFFSQKYISSRLWPGMGNCCADDSIAFRTLSPKSGVSGPLLRRGLSDPKSIGPLLIVSPDSCS